MIEGDLFRDNSEAFRRAVNEVTGIDGVIVKFDGREHRIAWFPEQIRSVNAAFDPDFADEPTLLAQEAADTSVAGGLTEKSVITTRSLAGASIVPIFADLTSSGNVYSDLDGMAVTPTPYFGGPNFPYLKDYRDAGMVWAFNKKGPATKLINHVRRLRDKAIEEGRDPRVVVTVLAMKDDAHTSNETVINVLLRTLDAVVEAGQFPQDQLSAAKKLIVGKAGKKDEGYSGLATFPGFDDGAKLAAWTRNATFATRKALANEMRSAKFRQLPGMFPINRIVREAIDPDYRATQQGDALVAFEIDPDADDIIIDFDQPEVRIPRHPAFRFGVKGKLVGSFGTHIPMDVLYSDLLAEVTERSKEGSNPKFLMERLRGTDRQIVTDEIVDLAEQIEQLDDYRAAKALVAGALGQWRSSDVDANKGGAAPAEFEQALVENEAAVTLTKYTRKDVFAGRRSGNLTVYQLGTEVVKNGGLNVWMGVKRDVDYRDEYPGEITQQLVDQGVITDKEVALVGVANNELGVRGMATFQVLKGIEEGVTILDAFKVRSPSKPDGLLPAIYATLGFEEVGEIPFDPQYYSDQEITALKAVWSRQGWTEGDGFPAVAIMKWRGDDALRSGATERFILESQAGLGIRGEPDVDQFDTTAASLLDGDVTRDEGDGRPRERDGRADPRRFADRARGLSGRARSFIANILAADERATDALKIDAPDVQALRDTYGDVDLKQDQELEAPGERGPRGLTRVPGPLGTGAVLGTSPTFVKLTKAENKTTFMHESAHVFLEIYAALEDTNEAVADRMKPLREWLGWEKGKPLTRDMHEKFAGLQGFEAYLTSGKAPLPEMVPMFEQFRGWFLDTYRRLRNQDINIDDQAREFFDRMLVTEDSVGAAEQQYHDSMMETMRGLMTPEQVAKHKRFAEKAARLARDRIFKKHLERIARRDRKSYKDLEKKVRAEVEALVAGDPIVKAMEMLTRDKNKVLLNADSVRDVISDKGSLDLLEPYMSAEGGMDVDTFADIAGFADADQMLVELQGDFDMERLIDAEVQRRMQALPDDLLVDEERAMLEAIEATFNDPQVRKLEVERDVLAQRALKEPIPLQAIRARAKRLIEETPINDIIKPGRYAMQAQNLHKRAVKMAAMGRFDEALRLTHKAMLQHEMARMAYKARAETEKINRFLARFARNRSLDPKKIQPAFIEMIRLVMAMPASGDQTSTRARLLEFEDRLISGFTYTIINENGEAQEVDTGPIEIVIPAMVYNGQDLPERRTMTLQELRDFRDSVKSIYKAGRDQSDMTRRQAFARNMEAADIIYDTWGGRKRTPEDYNKTKVREAADRLKQGVDNGMLRLPFFAQMLNGDQRRGPIVDRLYNKIAEAFNRKERRSTQLIDKLGEIFKAYKITGRDLSRTFDIPELFTVPGTRENLFVMLLNMGNEGNLQRLKDNPMWGRAARHNGVQSIQGDADAILAILETHLEPRHFQAAQEIWNLLETQRDALGEVQRKKTGVMPQWVEPAPLITRYGTFKGGYYPISYGNFVINSNVNNNSLEDAFEAVARGQSLKAQTRSGMAQARAEKVTAAISLDLNYIMTHINDVSARIEMTEAIDDAWNLATSPVYERAIKETFGEAYIGKRGMTQTILRFAAVDAMAHETADGIMNGVLRNVRIAFAGNIFGTFKTALAAPASWFETVIPEYKWNVAARGWMEWFGRGIAGVFRQGETMEQLSPFMAERKRLLNREAHDVAKRKVFAGTWSKAQAMAFVPMVVIEKYSVSGPLWWGVYTTSLEQVSPRLTKEEAIQEADKAVANTQGSGRILDQSVLQLNTNEMVKMLTVGAGFASGVYGLQRQKLGQSPKVMSKLMFLLVYYGIYKVASATMETLIREGMAAFEDDDEDEYAYDREGMYLGDLYLNKVMKLYARNVNVLPIADAILGQYDTTTAASDIGKKGRRAYDAWFDVFEEPESYGFDDENEVLDAVAKTAEVGALAFGVPFYLQAKNSLEAAQEIMEEGEDVYTFENLYKILVTGPTK